jgi:transmembrane sensor
VNSLFSNGENNGYLLQILENDWDNMLRDKTQSEVNLNHLLDRVHHIIRNQEMLKRQKPIQKFLRIYMKAAAILLLPLFLVGGLVYKSFGNHGMTTNEQQASSTIYAPLGSRVSFKLPDGTTGMLNSGSKLSYSIPFISNRKVVLEGESWFEVNPDEKHPFEISTGISKVMVLGTSFNISAYPTENYVEVVLQNGKVEFLYGKNNETVTMLPSERLVLKSGNISKSLTDPETYISWTEGKLVFRGDSMSEVVRRMERWYNVNIELKDKELENYSFMGTFEDDKLEDVLGFLSMTSPIRFLIAPRKLLADGTYEKEQVTISLKK